MLNTSSLTKKILKLLVKKKKSIHFLDTQLHNALFCGQVNIAKYIISMHCADVNSLAMWNDFSSSYRSNDEDGCCCISHYEQVQILIY